MNKEQKIDYIRQSGFINIADYNHNEVAIVGCGAVGSYVGITLAKMGMTKFKLYDSDIVEPHNLPNQFFEVKDIGRSKSRVLGHHMSRFNDECDIFTSDDWVDTDLKSEIVICAVDSMDTRKKLFETCEKDKECQLFIDSRMGGLQGQVYTVDMTDDEAKELYRKSLFPSEQAKQLPCTMRSIIFCVVGISSLICNQMYKVFREEQFMNYIVIDYTIPQMM